MGDTITDEEIESMAGNIANAAGDIGHECFVMLHALLEERKRLRAIEASARKFLGAETIYDADACDAVVELAERVSQ